MKDYPEKRHGDRRCPPERGDRMPPPDRRPPFGRPRDPFFDPFFDDIGDFFRPMFYNEPDRMRTDIKETDGGYVLNIELAGFDKNQIAVTLDDGYLTVSAQKGEQQSDESGKYILKESSVSCRRSYYVGEDIDKESVKAKFENGVLSLTVPKGPKQIPSKNIEIE